MQPRLTIGPTDDEHEREADRVADQVMRSPASGAAPKISPLIQRDTRTDDEHARDHDDEEEGQLQTKAQGASAASFAPRLAGEAAGGSLLPAAARNFLEPRFGRDLGHVRVHDGAGAAALATRINARAFTHGGHVYFGAGQYDPASTEGRRLLAHELAHTFQQGAGGPLRRKAAGELPAAVAARIEQPGGGEPVAAGVRAPVERQLGQGLGTVRVHRGPDAEGLADALDARAFTLGHDIWLGAGESAADRRLMAHELTHVAQQAGGAPARVQAKELVEWRLPALGTGGGGGPGTRAHVHLLKALGIEARDHSRDLFSEVPLMGGAASGNVGFPDLLATDTNVVPGVTFDGDGPKFQKLGGKTLHNGLSADAGVHAATAAPAGNAGGRACTGSGLPRNRGICRIDGPKDIYVGDLKPNDPAEIDAGEAQVGRYIAAIGALGTRVDDFATNNPSLIRPTGGRWAPQPQRMQTLPIPTEFASPTGNARFTAIAQLWKNGAPTRIKERATAEISKRPNGIWTYDWLALSSLAGYRAPAAKPIPAGKDAPPTAAAARIELDPVKEGLKAAPEGSVQRKPRSVRTALRRIQRKPGKISGRDEFTAERWTERTYGPWKRRAVAATGDPGGIRSARFTPDAERRLKDEAARQVKVRNPKSSVVVPAGTEQRTRELNLVQHWIDRGATYGRLRQVFGKGFVKLLTVYEKVKGWVETKIAVARLKFNKEGSGTSDPKRAALAGAKRVAGELLALFLRDIGHRLVGAVKTGTKTLLTSWFGAEKDAIAEEMARIEALEKQVREFIGDQIETRFRSILDQIQSVIDVVETAVDAIKKIGRVVELVKWALRLARCGAPPVLGCVIGLVSSKLTDVLLAGIIGGCWFRREIIYPIVGFLDDVITFPAVIAEKIANKARELLPDSLKPLIGPVDTAKVTSRAEDVTCGGGITPDPSQLKLAEMLADQDPAKVEALLKALEHIGVARIDADPKAKLTDAEIANMQALLKKYSVEQLHALVDNSEPAAPSTRTAGEALVDLDMAVTRGGTKAGDGPAGQPGDTPATVPGQPDPPGTPAGGGGDAGGGPPAPQLTEELRQKEGEDAKRRLARFHNLPANSARYIITPDSAEDAPNTKRGYTLNQPRWVFSVMTNSAGEVAGGFQKVTILEVRENNASIAIAAGGRFYGADGTYLFTNDQAANGITPLLRGKPSGRRGGRP